MRSNVPLRLQKGRTMVSSRWRPFELSIFSKMSQLATTHKAVNLAQGFPDFDGPAEVKEAAIQAIRQGRNQYAPATGILELRQALAKAQAAETGCDYDPQTEVSVFSGATEAIYCVITGLCEPGDEVIAFEPFYDSYPVGAMVAGATFKTVPLNAPDWTFDRAALEDYRIGGVIALIPHFNKWARDILEWKRPQLKL